MNKKIIVSIILFVSVVSFIWGFSERAKIAEAFSAYTTYSNPHGSFATSTPSNFIFLTWGTASTTQVIPTNGIETLEVTALVIASTTQSTNYDFLFETSRDGVDFFPMLHPVSSDTASSTISANSGTTYRSAVSTTATSSLPAIVIRPTGSFTRVTASVGTSTSLTSRGAIHIIVGAR